MTDVCTQQSLRIKSVREAEDAEGGYLYELQPTSYVGEWQPEVGTLLAIRSQGDRPEDEDR